MEFTPGFDDKCPWVPEGVTEWEAQEIRHHWRSALIALDDARGRIYEYADLLRRRGRGNVPLEADQFDHRVQGGGATHYAMQAEAEMVAMARVIDGAVHRLAVQSGDYADDEKLPTPEEGCG